MVLQQDTANRNPYQYWNYIDPNTLYNSDGTRKDATGANATQAGVEKVSGMIPGWGALIGAATGISKTARASNSDAGDFIGGAVAPHTQAFQDWGNVSHDTTTGQKVGDVFRGIGDIALGPAFSGIDSLIEGRKRREEQAGYNYNKQFLNGSGFGYSLDKNGINFSPQGRPIASQYTGGNAGATSAVSGLAGFGGDLLKQFLARPQQTDKSWSYHTGLNNQSPVSSIADNPYNFNQKPASPDGSNIVAPNYYIQSQDGQPNTSGGLGDNTQFGNNSLSLPNQQYGTLGSSLPSTGGQGIDSTIGLQGWTSSSPDSFGGSAQDSSFNGLGDTSGFNMQGDVSAGVSDNGIGFAEGGVAHVKGGDGDDDIALVDTNTGKDTNIRVEKGEMIVFSKDNVDALEHAVKSGNKDKAFALLADQLKQKGKQKDGKMNHSDGGKNATDEVDASSEAMAKHKADSERIRAMLGDPTTPEEIDKQIEAIKKKHPQTLTYYRTDAFGNSPSKKVDELEAKKKQIENGGLKVVESPSGEFQWKVPQGSKTIPTTQSAQSAIPADHPIVQSAMGEKYPNGFPKYKIENGHIVSLDVNGKVVKDLPTLPVQQMPTLNEFQPKLQTLPLTSNTTVGNTDAKKQNLDWQGAANYGADAAKIALGMAGAETPLPNWQVPADWSDHSRKMKYLSNTGLSPYQIALATNSADSAYLSTLERNKQVGGANPAAIMQADQIANQAHNQAALQLASADYGANLSNMRAYTPIVEQDVRNSRTLYDDEYSKAMMAKQAGALLANKAQDDMASQMQVDKYYGPNSDYGKLMDITTKQREAALKAQESDFGVQQKRIDNPTTPINNTPSDKSYKEYLDYQKWKSTQAQ